MSPTSTELLPVLAAGALGIVVALVAVGVAGVATLAWCLPKSWREELAYNVGRVRTLLTERRRPTTDTTTRPLRVAVRLGQDTGRSAA